MIQRRLGDWGNSMAAICQWVGGVSNLCWNNRVDVWSWCLQVERRNAIKDITKKKHCFSFKMQTCLPKWRYFLASVWEKTERQPLDRCTLFRNRWFVAETIYIIVKGGQITSPSRDFLTPSCHCLMRAGHALHCGTLPWQQQQQNLWCLNASWTFEQRTVLPQC